MKFVLGYTFSLLLSLSVRQRYCNVIADAITFGLLAEIDKKYNKQNAFVIYLIKETRATENVSDQIHIYKVTKIYST